MPSGPDTLGDTNELWNNCLWPWLSAGTGLILDMGDAGGPSRPVLGKLTMFSPFSLHPGVHSEGCPPKQSSGCITGSNRA